MSSVSTSNNFQFGAAWLTLPDVPFSLSFLGTAKGLHYCHIYLWIIKDISWMKGYFWIGNTFASAAVSIGMWMVINAFFTRSYDDMFIGFAQFLWLFGNMWWMCGELHDIQYHHAEPLYDKMAAESATILFMALAYAIVYLLVLRPMNIVKKDKSSSTLAEESKLPTRMLCFQRFRDYERMHLIFWLGKDFAWCTLFGPLWIIFFVPTYFMSLDFACITLNKKNAMIDHAHYLAQFLWVTGNGVWAIGEIFTSNDTPTRYIATDKIRWYTCRWYADVLLNLAFIPIILLYIFWIPNTLNGKIVKVIDASHGDHGAVDDCDLDLLIDEENQKNMFLDNVDFAQAGASTDSTENMT